MFLSSFQSVIDIFILHQLTFLLLLDVPGIVN